MPTFTPTMPYHVIQLPAYIEETTEGSTPTTGTLTKIGPQALFSIVSDKGAVPIFTLGARDPNTILDGRHISGFTLRFNPENTTFLKYAFNLEVGAGTIAKTLTFVAEITIGGTNYYFTANHCRLGTATVTGAPGSPLLADAYIVCKNPTFSTTAPSLTAPATPAAPLMFYTGGADPVKYGTNVLDTESIVVRVDNNLIPIWVMGSQEYQQVQTGARDFSAAVSGVLRNTTQLTDYLAFTPRTFVWTVDSVGPKTFTITAGNLVSLRDLSFDIGDLSATGRYGRGGGAVTETYMVFGTSIALT